MENFQDHPSTQIQGLLNNLANDIRNSLETGEIGEHFSSHVYVYDGCYMFFEIKISESHFVK